MYDYFAWIHVYVSYMFLVLTESEEGVRHLGLELRIVVCHHVDHGTLTRVFCKKQQVT